MFYADNTFDYHKIVLEDEKFILWWKEKGLEERAIFFIDEIISVRFRFWCCSLLSVEKIIFYFLIVLNNTRKSGSSP